MSSATQVEGVQRLVRESVATVDAMAPDALRAVLPALRAVRSELQGDMLDWLAHADQADRFSALRRAELLRSLEGTFDRVQDLDPAMGHALTAGRHVTGPLAIANLETEISRLSAIFGHGVPTMPDINTAAILAQGDKLLWRRHENSARRYAGRVGDDIKHLLAVGVAKHETVEQLVARLRGLGGSRKGAFDPGHDSESIAGGLFQRHRYWADRLVRTELMHAYNLQHDVAIEHANENRPDGEDEYVRKWDASADPITCYICRALDGTTAPIGGTFPGGYGSPPIHPHDRCVTLAWNKRWGNLRGESPMKREAQNEPPPPAPIKPTDGPRSVENRIDDHADGLRIGVGRIHDGTSPDVEPTRAPVPRQHVPESAYRQAAERAAAELKRVVEAAEAAVAAAKPRGTTSIWQPGDENRGRKVVHHARREKPQEEWYQEDLRKQRERQERAALMHEGAARQRSPERPPPVNPKDLAQARVQRKSKWWWPFGRAK